MIATDPEYRHRWHHRSRSSRARQETFRDISLLPLSGDGSAPREAYRLMIAPDRIVVVGATPGGLAHGARPLIQLLHTTDILPCLTIEDAPVMARRVVMLDISRGKVPTLATLQNHRGHDRFHQAKHAPALHGERLHLSQPPGIGAGWGAMTPEDVVALDTYCRDRFT